MSLVKKSVQLDKQCYGDYQILLEAFISEDMLRRLLSFRRTKLETPHDFQSEVVDSQIQKIAPELEETETQESKIGRDQIKRTESSECSNSSETKTNFEKHNLNDVTPEPPVTLSDNESEAIGCLIGEEYACDESDRCESSTSVEGCKEDSGIEQDFEPKTKIEKPLPEVKKEVGSQIQSSEVPPVQLVPTNHVLNTHLKQNHGKQTTESPISEFVTNHARNHSTGKGYKCSFQNMPTLVASLANSTKPYPRVTPVVTYARTPRNNKNREMFGELILKDGFRTASLYQFPIRKESGKRPNNSKHSTPSTVERTSKKKNKVLSFKAETKNSSSSDSGLSDGESSEEQKRMPVKKIFSNQQALRKKIDDLNGILKTMEQQKTELQTVLRIVEDWSKDLQRVERTNLGVPYIRCVKEILAQQRKALSSRKSDFNRRLTKLKEAKVPFNEEFCDLIQQLKNEITCLVRDHRKYSARSVENIRHIQGRVIGTCIAIMEVYY